MTDFVSAMSGQIRSEDVEPLYLRASAILVRPGNAKKITSFADLLKPGVKVMVVQGAGQTGMWEDIAGRKGDIETVRSLRKNIALFAPNSAAAKEEWIKDKSFDAWIIWTIWQKANPELADVVEIESDLRVYRDTGVAPTKRGKAKPEVAAFIAFLKSDQGKKSSRSGAGSPTGHNRVSDRTSYGAPAACGAVRRIGVHAGTLSRAAIQPSPSARRRKRQPDQLSALRSGGRLPERPADRILPGFRGLQRQESHRGEAHPLDHARSHLPRLERDEAGAAKPVQRGLDEGLAGCARRVSFRHRRVGEFIDLDVDRNREGVVEPGEQRRGDVCEKIDIVHHRVAA